jgi:hypothetical protein
MPPNWPPSGAQLRLDLDPVRDGEAYDQARRLWLARLGADPANATLLGNAADFFIHRDPALCEELLRRAEALEPRSPEWPERLAHHYGLAVRPLVGEARRGAAARAFAELERAAGLEADDLKRWWLLPDLAKAAFEAGAFDVARGYATDLLRGAERLGYCYHRNGAAVHYGNLVLGRLALRSGDVAAAKAHLLESGRTSGSPVLRSGGPNMALAKELLELGERGAVVAFLRLCNGFWRTSDHRAEQWAYAIEQGGTPDFGANLDY